MIVYFLQLKNILDNLSAWASDLSTILSFFILFFGAVGAMYVWFAKKKNILEKRAKEKELQDQKEKTKWFHDQFQESVKQRDAERAKRDLETDTTLNRLNKTLDQVDKNQNNISKQLDLHDKRISILEDWKKTF